MKNEMIWQVLTEDEFGTPVVQSWHTSEEEARKNLSQYKTFWPDDPFWIEPGTDHINEKCRGCGTVHCSEEHDAYGISTGFWCTDCYNSSKYPYRKDRYYDSGYAGEHLEEEDY